MPRTAKFDHTLIAGLVDDARRQDLHAIPHVAQALNVDRAAAKSAIGSARRAGVLLPLHTIPKQRRPAPVDLVLRCDSCPKTYPVHTLLDLYKHCRREHGRQPSREEKTPR